MILTHVCYICHHRFCGERTEIPDTYRNAGAVHVVVLSQGLSEGAATGILIIFYYIFYVIYMLEICPS